MANFNQCLLIGNLTRDPEVGYLPKGTAVCNFDIAINRKWTTESGDSKEEVCFVPCTVFGRTAETIGQYLKKGNPIFVSGRLKLEQWDDKETGQKRSKLKVVVESFQFIGAKKDGGNEYEQPSPGTEREAAQTPQGRKQRPAEQEAPAGEGETPIPF